MRDWYNGYLFGETEIYNPWSVISYVYEKVINGRPFPAAYWANTSSNSIIHDLVERADAEVKRELDQLVDFGTIEKKIHEDITYDDIYKSEDNLWNFLFFTGYMRKVSERYSNDDNYLTMRIPNREIRSIFKGQISEWFDKVVRDTNRGVFWQAVLSGNTEEMKKFITSLLKKSISTFDSLESFYHGFLLSTLIGTPDYVTQSNREEGDGRPDIVLYPENPEDPAILFEIKVRKSFAEMRGGIEEAFEQIRNRRYEEGILDDGYNGVVSFGVCFCKKAAIFEKLNP
ncbi:MAG: PD-(D/E)XK nuclease domain-containing protein [Lachnospiraceae bacterium]|nr:PD-(D/E)XK nuclease domain-containing protein [Lachnospiraceae bacterium]